jgi:hypothetical protein
VSKKILLSSKPIVFAIKPIVFVSKPIFFASKPLFFVIKTIFFDSKQRTQGFVKASGGFGGAVDSHGCSIWEPAPSDVHGLYRDEAGRCG